MAVIWKEEEFKQEVLQSEIPALVDFYADWCGPCKMVSPAVEALAMEYEGRVKIGKINVDESPNVAAAYGVMSIPMLLFFKNGEIVDRIIGAVPKKQIAEKVEALL